MSIIRTAEILCVGTELLLGDIVNTNAAYLARQLAELGIGVYHQSVVGDHPERLKDAIDLALSRADLVITSGGLGPTYDDITREVVAAAFGRELLLDEDILAGIRSYFARSGRVMTDNNRRQAMVPVGADVLPNRQGTAPGLILADATRGKTAILLPGPPRELEPMFSDFVKSYLAEHTDSVLMSKNVHIFGMGESAVENVLKDMMTEGKNPTVAPYCKAGEVRLRVTAKAADEVIALAMCDTTVDLICGSAVGPYVYAVTDAREGECSLEITAIRALLESGKTVATAESCTGGLIAKRLTDIPGSSAAVLGGFVTYTNEMKMSMLGVSPDTLEQYTAVSEQTAAEMARGARMRTGADVALSTTGFAGPGGGTDDCPVGTVFVGISTETGEKVKRLTLSPDRSRDYIRTLAASHALRILLDELSKSGKV
jgi:nicotinamide-nucleotide amidase